jgi:transcriptional regulator with PAS, ATPase and Fis domain
MLDNLYEMRCQCMVWVKRNAHLVYLGQVKTTVLIFGESGTGKGIIAKLIHKYSDRAPKAMITINFKNYAVS